MIVDDVKLLTYFKGARIKLTLKTSSFFGVVKRIYPNKALILADVVNSDGWRFPGTKIFFGHEILNVEFTSDGNGDRENIHHHKPEDHLDVAKFQPYRKTGTLDDDEEDEEYINYVVVDEFHEKFGPTIMHIKKQRVIGVGAEGVEVFKNGRLCWLQIATKNKVYLFDVLLLGARAFKNGLAMILESKDILKVIHDCRAIAGCLIAQFGVKLANVFDTQVADVMCFYSETGGFLPDRVSTLHEVLSLHLRVPPSQLSSLQMKSQFTKEESEMWHTRPCPLPLLKVMALSVSHLQPLRLVLLDTLMRDYMALVDSYLSSSHYQPDELAHVGMESVLELPRELRQLEVMRRERHEWASSHYPLTEQGLLARFSPKPQSSSQASPAVEEDQRKNHPDVSEPASVESPSPSPQELLVNHSATSPLRVTSGPAVDAQDSAPATVSDLTNKEPINCSLSAGMGRGDAGVRMDLTGRGRLFGKEQPSNATFPFIGRGRGFLLHLPPTQIPIESAGDFKHQCSVKATPFQDKMSEPGLGK